MYACSFGLIALLGGAPVGPIASDDDDEEEEVEVEEAGAGRPGGGEDDSAIFSRYRFAIAAALEIGGEAASEAAKGLELFLPGGDDASFFGLSKTRDRGGASWILGKVLSRFREAAATTDSVTVTAVVVVVSVSVTEELKLEVDSEVVTATATAATSEILVTEASATAELGWIGSRICPGLLGDGLMSEEEGEDLSRTSSKGAKIFDPSGERGAW